LDGLDKIKKADNADHDSVIAKIGKREALTNKDVHCLIGCPRLADLAVEHFDNA